MTSSKSTMNWSDRIVLIMSRHAMAPFTILLHLVRILDAVGLVRDCCTSIKHSKTQSVIILRTFHRYHNSLLFCLSIYHLTCKKPEIS